MTEANFIALHFPQGQENQPGTIHLNVNQVGSTSQGIITSMIITTDAYSIDGQTDITYIENVLEQIESVRFSFNGTEYELIISSRSYYPAKNAPFFYYTVEPAYVPDYFDANLLTPANTAVTFTPYLIDVQFGFSEFNPLISNASIGRKSDRIMQSDRLEQTVLPSNINALLSESAEKASIQDSLYSDTGWSNARYQGSETSARESAGIAPTISGRTFIGEVFASDSDTDYICALDSRINQELFHTSDTPLPTFSLSDFEVTLASEFNQLQTQFIYSDITTLASGSLAIGDVLASPTLILTGQTEYMKITEINSNRNRITVTRDIYNAFFGDLASWPSSTIFTKINRFDIFRFGTGQNRIQLVNNSRIYINGNNTIIDTDDYGQIVSSSQCPYIGYIVED